MAFNPIPLSGICEPASCFSHLLAALVFAGLAIQLVRRGRGSTERCIALSIFAFSVVLLLIVSGIYHIFPVSSTTRQLMVRLDSAAIFLLIAGTYTPMKVILFKGQGRWRYLALIWGLSLGAMIYKTFVFDAISRWMSLCLYLGLGWISLYSCYFLVRKYGLRFIEPVVLGGICYTIGGLLNLFRTPTMVPGVIGPHEIWHFFVIAALGFHWHFAYQIAKGEEHVSVLSQSYDKMVVSK